MQLTLLLLSLYIECDGDVFTSDTGLCGVHIERTGVDAHGGKIVSSTFKEEAKDDIRMLRNNVGSQDMFLSLINDVMEHWISKGESAFAEGFAKEYFAENYNNWNINSFPDVYANPIENNTVESSHKRDKINRFGAGSRTKVSLSEYVTRSIPEMLKEHTRSHSGRPISVDTQDISTGYPSSMLINAQRLLQETVDHSVTSKNQVALKQSSSSSQSVVAKKEVYAHNYYHFQKGTKLLSGSAKSEVGYIVFNTGDNLVQDKGLGRNVTKHDGLQYIDCVLHGRFPKDTDYEQKKKFVRRFVLLSYDVLHVDTKAVYEYSCRCKVGRGQGECEHEAAASHMLRTFDVLAQVHQISRGTVRGRPRLSSIVGYAAVKSSETTIDVTTLHSADYERLVLEKIIQFYNKPFSAEPFIGTVQGTRLQTNVI